MLGFPLPKNNHITHEDCNANDRKFPDRLTNGFYLPAYAMLSTASFHYSVPAVTGVRRRMQFSINDCRRLDSRQAVRNKMS